MPNKNSGYKVFYQKRNDRLVIVDNFARIVEIISFDDDGDVQTLCVTGYLNASMVYIGEF